MASCIFQVISNLLMLVLLFGWCGDSQGPELDCIPSIRVSRNAVWWKSSERETLKINCTVLIESHCWKNLSVFWCKIGDGDHCRPLSHSNHTGTEWRDISGEERMFFLIFQRLSVEDAGLYRCRSDKPVSTSGHTINITVTAPVTDVEVVGNENTARNVNLDSEGGSQTNTTISIRDTEQSAVQQVYVLYSIVIVVTVVLAVPVLFQTISNKDSDQPLEDQDLLTTVSYEAAEDSSLQD
ncbi:hypothetical protein NFI96_000409 [Prochilodus magdalenae]|nr:hypothetical protein NFI96_000409 [Prochilodus magdalenae]